MRTYIQFSGYMAFVDLGRPAVFEVDPCFSLFKRGGALRITIVSSHSARPLAYFLCHQCFRFCPCASWSWTVLVKFAGMLLIRRTGRGCLCPASGVQWFANPLVQNLYMGPLRALPKGLLLPSPAASGPGLGALALVRVRGRPLLFCPSFSPVFLPSS